MSEMTWTFDSPDLRIALVRKAKTDRLDAVRGTFFACYPDTDERTLFVEPRSRVSGRLDRDIVWKQRLDLAELIRSAFPDLRLDPCTRESAVLSTVNRTNALALGPNADLKDVLVEVSRGTQAGIDAFVHKELRSPVPVDAPVYRTDAPDYSHIRHFARIYSIELQALTRAFNSTRDPQSDFICLDAGCGFGHFVGAATACLPQNVISGIQFIGVDQNERDLAVVRRNLQTGGGLNYAWHFADIAAPGFADRLEEIGIAPPVDFMVVNHVLEYFDAEPPMAYICRWLSLARVLAVSVPIGDPLHTTISAHARDFTTDDLLEWAETVPKSMGKPVAVDTSAVPFGLLRFTRV